MSKKWLTFEGFFEDMGHPPFDGAQVERKDNSKGYSKSNCRWATRQANMNNTRFNQHVRVGAKRTTLSNLVRASGLKYSTVYQRLTRYGTPPAEVLKGSSLYPTPVVLLGKQGDFQLEESGMAKKSKGGGGKGGGGKKGCLQP